MTNIKTLMDIEEVLLKSDNDFRYTYSLDELIKSEKYIKEIGEITNLFLAVQIEYGKISVENYKQNLVDYHNKLISDELEIDISKYIEFISNSISNKATDKEYYNKVEKILALAN